MNTSSTRILPLLFFVALAGCRSNGVHASSRDYGATAASESSQDGDISGPPTFNERYQVRNPRVCGQVMQPPTAAQAAALVQCSSESDTSATATPAIWVTTGVQVQIGAPRPYISGTDDRVSIDPSAKVYPIRGQGTRWSCFPASERAPGQNCMQWPATPTGQGSCFKTTFGNWECVMSLGGGQMVQNLKGPTTY